MVGIDKTGRRRTTYLLIIALVAIGAVLRLMASILTPFIIATLLSFVLGPVMTYMVKRRIPRGVAVAIILTAFLAFGFLIAFVVYESFQSLLREFPKYQERLLQLVQALIVRFELPDNLLEELGIRRGIGNVVLSASGNFFDFLTGFLVVLIYLLFLLLEQPYLRRKTRNALKRHSTRTIALILAHTNQQISRYLAVKLFVSALTGSIVLVSFTLIGVDFAFIWGLLTFLFNFIPTIGSIAISFLASIFAIVQFVPDWNSAIAAALSISIAQLIIGNILDPKMLGDRLNLSPVVILFSLLTWGWLWGTAGLFLAVPLTVVLKIIFENTPGMQPVSILMGTGSFREVQLRRNAAAQRRD